MARHALELVDRGPQHRHRWHARCLCGAWSGIPLRVKRSAVTSYRRHVEADAIVVAARSRTRTGRGAALIGPRPCTPVDRLPDALRQRNGGLTTVARAAIIRV